MWTRLSNRLGERERKCENKKKAAWKFSSAVNFFFMFALYVLLFVDYDLDGNVVFGVLESFFELGTFWGTGFLSWSY